MGRIYKPRCGRPPWRGEEDNEASEGLDKLVEKKRALLSSKILSCLYLYLYLCLYVFVPYLPHGLDPVGPSWVIK